MADFGRFKKNSLGAPPTMSDIKDNLSQPEIAPMNETLKKTPPTRTVEAITKTLANKPQKNQLKSEAKEVIKSADKDTTNKEIVKMVRTKPLATKVSPEFHKQLKTLAALYEKDMVEIIEEAVMLWIAEKNKEI